MSSEVLQQAVGAGVTATFGRGRIFNLLAATFPVSVVAEVRAGAGGQTQQRNFTNIPAGSKFVAEKGHEWTYLRVTSTNAQNITMFVGDEDLSFNNAVTVTGTAAVAIAPSSVINSLGPTVRATGGADTVALNLSRRRITIAMPVSNTGTMYVQTVGRAVAGQGIPLQPGGFVELVTTSAFDIRNDSGANQSYSTFEET